MTYSYLTADNIGQKELQLEINSKVKETKLEAVES